MYPAAVPEELRGRGHDIVAVQERRELVGPTDAEILASARAERRVLVTEDTRVLRESSGLEAHHGILFTCSRSVPHDMRRLGPLIAALEGYLRAHPDDDHLLDRTEWLTPSQ